MLMCALANNAGPTPLVAYSVFLECGKLGGDGLDLGCLYIMYIVVKHLWPIVPALCSGSKGNQGLGKTR